MAALDVDSCHIVTSFVAPVWIPTLKEQSVKKIYVATVDDLHKAGSSSPWKGEQEGATIIDSEVAKNGGVLFAGFPHLASTFYI